MENKSLLNKAAVRKYILDKIKKDRPGFDCTRVAPAAIGILEQKLIKLIKQAVWSHPSRGKTFCEII